MSVQENTNPIPRDDLAARLRDRILGSELATDRTKVGAEYISGLLCPECGEREAWAYASKPFVIFCNRANNCGAKIRSWDLFPDLRVRIERDYPPTDLDPNRPAREFLKVRGLEKSLEGLDFGHVPRTREGCGGGVGFPIGKLTDKGEAVYPSPAVLNIRLYNPPAGEGKTHNTGKLGENYWSHPGRKLDLEQPVYITEGILNALSLWEMGLPAIAVLSANRDPRSLSLPLKRITLAFDSDKAGQAAFRRWKLVYPTCEALTLTEVHCHENGLE